MSDAIRQRYRSIAATRGADLFNSQFLADLLHARSERCALAMLLRNNGFLLYEVRHHLDQTDFLFLNYPMAP